LSKREKGATGRARYLRREETEVEKLLWRKLKDRRLGGFKFRRQHPVGIYVLDFYCAEKGLAVELDGGGHARGEKVERDRVRDAFLESAGIRVVRFWNRQVREEMDVVVERILFELEPEKSEWGYLKGGGTT
jgi:very-short-patch-repair endonuclease